MLRLVLCVTGSVAGIKAAELVSKLQQSCDVKVVTTAHGHVFLEKPQAGRSVPPCCTDTDDYQDDKDLPLHIELAAWADVLVFAPLSANSLAKLSLGLADNLATRLFRAWDVANKPVLVAPAMNSKMWVHPATAGHLEKLRTWGVAVVEPVAKMLACGDVGVGAMAAVDEIVATAERNHRQP
eukprot:jgi/Ulvmu1/6809/UM031_0012.1